MFHYVLAEIIVSDCSPQLRKNVWNYNYSKTGKTALIIFDFLSFWDSCYMENTSKMLMTCQKFHKIGNFYTRQHFFNKIGTNGVNSAPFCHHTPSTISWIDYHCDLPHSLLHALLPLLGPWHPDRTQWWLWGQALVGVGVCAWWIDLGSSPCSRPWAGGQSTYRALEAAPALSVPVICHLGPQLPDCTSFLLIRSFPTS